MDDLAVIASEAKQSGLRQARHFRLLDCFASLAMTQDGDPL
ncbi:hypothetical protein [Labrys sp. WJW]|nr:hypothetical protein [Labrys sp. WJW]